MSFFDKAHLQCKKLSMRLAIYIALLYMNTSPVGCSRAEDANQLPIYSMSNELREPSSKKATSINLNEQDTLRFWSKVDIKSESECWPWNAGRFTQGYGAFKLNGKLVKASRVAFTLSRGPIPDGMMVCHDCNNPCCSNPKHLFAGSNEDNMRHMVECGRSLVGDLNPMRIHPEFHVRGEKHLSSKLTTEKVLDIRARFDSGTATLTSLGREYGVTKQSISAIVKRKTWTHI